MVSKEFKIVQVFLLQHSYKISGYCDEGKYIGLFSSLEKAKRTINKLKCQEGFKKHKNGFSIDRYIVDQVFWKKSINYQNSKNFNKKNIYQLEYDISEDNRCEVINIVGFFSSKKRANNAVRKIKNKKGLLLQSVLLNQVSWEDGFFTR